MARWSSPPTLVDIGRPCKNGHTGQWKLNNQNQYVCHTCAMTSYKRHRLTKKSATPLLFTLIFERDQLAERLKFLDAQIEEELKNQ